MAGFGWRRPSQRMEISPKLGQSNMGWRGNKTFPAAHFASGGVAGADLGETFPTAQSQTPNQQGSDEALFPGEMNDWLLNRKASPYPNPLTAPVVDPNLVNNFNAQYGPGTASPFEPAPANVPTGTNNSLVGDTIATPVPLVNAPGGQGGWMPPPPIQNDFNQGQDGLAKPMPPPQFLGPPIGPPGSGFTGTTPGQGQGAWQGQPWNQGAQAFAQRRRQWQPG